MPLMTQRLAENAPCNPVAPGGLQRRRWTPDSAATYLLSNQLRISLPSRHPTLAPSLIGLIFDGGQFQNAVRNGDSYRVIPMYRVLHRRYYKRTGMRSTKYYGRQGEVVVLLNLKGLRA